MPLPRRCYVAAPSCTNQNVFQGGFVVRHPFQLPSFDSREEQILVSSKIDVAMDSRNSPSCPEGIMYEAGAILGLCSRISCKAQFNS